MVGSQNINLGILRKNVHLCQDDVSSQCEFKSQINLERIHILSLMTTSYNWQIHLAGVELSGGSHGPNPPIDLWEIIRLASSPAGPPTYFQYFPPGGRRGEQLFMMGLNWTSVGGGGDSWVWAVGCGVGCEVWGVGAW